MSGMRKGTGCLLCAALAAFILFTCVSSCGGGSTSARRSSSRTTTSSTTTTTRTPTTTSRTTTPRTYTYTAPTTRTNGTSSQTTVVTTSLPKPDRAAVDLMAGTWHLDQLIHGVQGDGIEFFCFDQLARLAKGHESMLSADGYAELASLANSLFAQASITFHEDGTGGLSATLDKPYEAAFTWYADSDSMRVRIRWASDVDARALPRELSELDLLRYPERLHVYGLLPAQSNGMQTGSWFARGEETSLPQTPRLARGAYELVATYDHGFDAGYDAVLQEVYDFSEDYDDYDYEWGDAGDLEWVLPSLYMSTVTVDAGGELAFSMQEVDGLDGAAALAWMEDGYHAQVAGNGGETYQVYALGDYLFVTSQDGFAELKHHAPFDQLYGLVFKLVES